MIDRSIPPKAQPLGNIQLPAYQFLDFGWEKNTLWLPYQQQPIIFFELRFQSGRYFEQTPGLSYFALRMLGEGTINKSSAALAEAFESLGSYLDLVPGIDYNAIRLYCRREFLSESLKLIEEILFEPAFSPDEYLHMREVRRANLEQQLARNPQFATLNLLNKLFGSNHPYGYILQPDDLDAIQIEEVERYYQQQLFTRPRCTVVGNLTTDDENQIRQILTRLSHFEQKNNINIPTTADLKQTEINREGSTQASLRLGGHTIGYNHPDADKLSIAITMLGGFFGSRLMQVIREEKGLTYGIYASINHQYQADYWQLGSEVQKEKTTEALEAIHFEINRLANEPCLAKELNTLKNYKKGSILSSMDSILNIAQTYTKLWQSGKPIDHVMEYLKAIDGITSEDISEMVDCYLVKNPSVVLIVG